MKIRHLQIFLSVCDHENSVTQAAKALFMSQPSVTQAIHELEEYYKVRLFDRLSRRLYLTAAGEEFQSYARRLMGIYEDMENHFSNWDGTGVLRIGASMTWGTSLMPPIMHDFRKQHPNSHTRVIIQPSRFLQDKIMQNELDLALLETPVQNSALHADHLFSDRLCVITSADDELTENKMTKEEFAKREFLLREPGSGSRDIFEQVMERSGLSVTPVWEAESTTALLNAVKQGMGITVLPRLLVQESVLEGRIKEVKVQDLDFRQDFYVVYHKDKLITRLIKDFIACSADVLHIV